MVKALIGALALAALPCSLAFKNTSPFFLFSTLPLNFDDHHASVASYDDVLKDTMLALDDCNAHTYILVRQEGVSANDFHESRSAPRLSYYLSGKKDDIKTRRTISEVYGDVSTDELSRKFVALCDADAVKMDGPDGEIPKASHSSQRIIEVTFPAPSAASRATTLEQYDSILDDIITTSAGSKDYTVIYTTSPPREKQASASAKAQQTYEMETAFDEGIHMELKRDVGTHARGAVEKQGGLFERYQFFTPGIFMGFVAVIPLFLVIYVGYTALAGLEVSYFAFSKEMGPSGKSKQG